MNAQTNNNADFGKPMVFVKPKRFTLEEYHQLFDLGFFNENSRVELIRGEIIEMVAKGTPHSVCNTLLLYALIPLLGNQAIVRSQEPITLLDNSEPEPDVAIVQPRPDRYLSAHPGPSDILLMIEVSDSTLEYDQTTKLSLYAEAQISHYWIVNLVANHLESYSNPYQSYQGGFGYRSKQILLPNESLSLPGFPNLFLPLAMIFPGEVK